jgi:hypothetical protein
MFGILARMQSFLAPDQDPTWSPSAAFITAGCTTVPTGFAGWTNAG